MKRDYKWRRGHVDQSEGAARPWLATLPAELSRHRALLLDLLAALERDPRWRWLELGCSVADGRGDALSDLDLGLGIAEEAWPDALDNLATLLASLGEVIDILRHRFAGMGDQPHQRIFVQYADGVQIDLVAVPAHLPRGTQPESVILYDPDALRAGRWPPSVLQADAASVREWAFLGWIALADLAKYLQRGSLWEALERLEQARTQIWRLWATTQGIRYPVYGLTAALDHPEAGLPPDIDRSVAGLDRVELLRAGLTCAELLDRTAMSAARTVGGEVPGAMARFVRQKLEEAAG